MIQSFQRLEFIPTGGSAVRLLDFGDWLSEPLSFPIEGQSGIWKADNAADGEPYGLGGRTGKLAWSVIRNHKSHLDAMDFQRSHRLAVPICVSGIIRETLREPEAIDGTGQIIWEHAAIIQACVPALTTDGLYPTVTSYQAVTGASSRTSGTAVGTYTPPALDPGTPPDLIAATGNEPGLPPDLLPRGIMISGVTTPATINGFIPLAGVTEGRYYFEAPGVDASCDSVESVGTDLGLWTLGSAANPAKYFLGGPARYPWDVTSWAAQGGAVGTPVITPVNLLIPGIPPAVTA